MAKVERRPMMHAAAKTTRAITLLVTHAMWSAVLVSAALCMPAEAAAQTSPALENNNIEIVYSEPRASFFKPIYERYKERHLLEELKQFLSPLILPTNVKLRITTKECGTVNSWWSGRKDGLFLCYEWPDYAERIAPLNSTPDGMTRESAVLGAFLQVTFHELGHAMFDIFEIPVFGREEDAADQMAGFILAQFGEDVARRTFPGAVYLWQKLAEEGGPPRRDVFSDEHGYPLQRAYNYLCMAYGAKPNVFQYYVDKKLLPQARAVNCKREFDQIEMAFIKTLLPHIDPAKMKVVQSTQWLLPPGGEPIPKQ